MKVLRESWNAHMKRVLKAKASTLAERVACFLMGHRYSFESVFSGDKSITCIDCGKEKSINR